MTPDQDWMTPMPRPQRGPAPVIVLDARRRYGALAEERLERLDRRMRARRWVTRHGRLATLVVGTMFVLLAAGVLITLVIEA